MALNGAQGLQGETGATGVAGADGRDGASAYVVGCYPMASQELNPNGLPVFRVQTDIMEHLPMK